MSNHTLTFTLKQHTPLIHFQHDQEGATLRATEVKAKLDRFLVQQLFFDYFDKCKEHLIGYDPKNEAALRSRFDNEGFRGLNYKLKFNAGEVRLLPIGKVGFQEGKLQWIGAFPSFFANMGDENKQNPKYFSIVQGGILVQIHSIDAGLIGLLKSKKELFERFFSINNFGTRQSKGFGSFSLVNFEGNSAGLNFGDRAFKFKIQAPNPNMDQEKKQIYTQNQYREKEIAWVYDQEFLFGQIDLFYRTLRSGINIPNRNPDRSVYFKSLMFHYAKKDNYQWDKKTIRLHFYKDHPKFQEVLRNRRDPEGTVQYRPNGENRDGYDFRNLLGLSTDQQWLYYDKDSLTRTGKTRPNQFNQSEDIERMRSPITFKPIATGDGSFDVYLIPEKMPEGYLGARITTTSKKNSRSGDKHLMIPPEFSTAEYLRWAVEHYNTHGKGHFFGAGVNSREASQIDDIYQQLYKNLK